MGPSSATDLGVWTPLVCTDWELDTALSERLSVYTSDVTDGGGHQGHTARGEYAHRVPKAGVFTLLGTETWILLGLYKLGCPHSWGVTDSSVDTAEFTW